jgi:hypothetical protein
MVFLISLMGCTGKKSEIDRDELRTAVISPPEKVIDVIPTSQPVDPSLTPEPTAEASDPDRGGSELGNAVEKELGLKKGSLIVTLMEPKTWRDASLGCPEPGMVYAQVITEGWLIKYAGPKGEEIPVHTDREMKHYTICIEEIQPQPEQEYGDEDKLLVEVAKQHLAEELDISVDKIDVSAINAVSWPNSCLGCAEIGEVCLSVITPGYQILLTVDDRIYAVHTNNDGSVNRLCKWVNKTNPQQ